MNPGTYPLQLYRGDSYRWQFTCYDDAAQTQPSDLTGATVASQIRDKPGGTYVCSLTCTVTLPNIINTALAASDSAELPNSAAWDLQITYASGDVATLVAGPVNVTADVTDLSAPAVAPTIVFARRAAQFR